MSASNKFRTFFVTMIFRSVSGTKWILDGTPVEGTFAKRDNPATVGYITSPHIYLQQPWWMKCHPPAERRFGLNCASGSNTASD
jgi:hypothetical protein